MTISDDDHMMISNITKSIAIDITEMLGLISLWGATVESQIPEHYCAYEHAEEAEELIIRMPNKCVSIKVTVQGTDYARDRVIVEEEESEDQGEVNQKFLDILKGLRRNG